MCKYPISSPSLENPNVYDSISLFSHSSQLYGIALVFFFFFFFPHFKTFLEISLSQLQFPSLLMLPIYYFQLCLLPRSHLTPLGQSHLDTYDQVDPPPHRALLFF